jgi:hypothetical protein
LNAEDWDYYMPQHWHWGDLVVNFNFFYGAKVDHFGWSQIEFLQVNKTQQHKTHYNHHEPPPPCLPTPWPWAWVCQMHPQLTAPWLTLDLYHERGIMLALQHEQLEISWLPFHDEHNK